MTDFDPVAFMGQETSDAMDSDWTQIPDGEYKARIENVQVNERIVRDEPRIVANLTWLITDEAVLKAMGTDRLTVNQQLFLDLDENTQQFERGQNKNVKLGAVREAVDLNTPGQPFSLMMLKDRGPAIVQTKQTTSKTDASRTFVNVVAVAPLPA